MANQKQYYFLSYFLLLVFLLLQAGCRKEYSYEGGMISVKKDTIFQVLPPVKEFPGCSSCRVTDELLISKWNFKIGNSFQCGSVDAAGTLGDKSTFTFFGPSACSIDTGLVMTIYLPEILNEDKFNLTTDKVAFYYYDHNATNDILISYSTAPFSVTVQSFIYATGIVTGTFSGTAFKPNGDKVFVSEGKFKIKLR